MTTSPPAGPRWKPLDARQRRVLGVLIEKAKTTPAAYPITVNALVTGCNQKNNREPLTTYDDIDVEKALDELRTLGVVSEIDWLGRVSKYKHSAYEWLGVSKPEIAIMTELLLRGAQALGDLRGRAARMEPIADMAALKPIVDALVERGLMLELTPAGRGQIVSHNLYLPQELGEVRAAIGGQARHSPMSSLDDEPAARERRTPESPRASATAYTSQAVLAPGSDSVPSERVRALSAELAELRAEVARLRERVSELEAKLTT